MMNWRAVGPAYLVFDIKTVDSQSLYRTFAHIRGGIESLPSLNNIPIHWRLPCRAIEEDPSAFNILRDFIEERIASCGDVFLSAAL